ncbi:MAG: hypothetical protein AAF527_03950 [Pseudomonadota bacterium]
MLHSEIECEARYPEDAMVTWVNWREDRTPIARAALIVVGGLYLALAGLMAMGLRPSLQLWEDGMNIGLAPMTGSPLWAVGAAVFGLVIIASAVYRFGPTIERQEARQTSSLKR